MAAPESCGGFNPATLKSVRPSRGSNPNVFRRASVFRLIEVVSRHDGSRRPLGDLAVENQAARPSARVYTLLPLASADGIPAKLRPRIVLGVEPCGMDNANGSNDPVNLPILLYPLKLYSIRQSLDNPDFTGHGFNAVER
jgi:hypothetical protein